MKLLLLTAVSLLTSCAIDWKSLGLRAGQAALDASAPIILEEITTKPGAKQPRNVQP
jgi:hypothetical protein